MIDLRDSSSILMRSGGPDMSMSSTYRRREMVCSPTVFVYRLLTVGTEFQFKREHVIQLANECSVILGAQPIVIKEMKPPLKIFGDLHG